MHETHSLPHQHSAARPLHFLAATHVSGGRLDPDNALLLHVQPLPEGPSTQLSLLDLLAIPRTSLSAPLFAPTLEALHQLIEERHGNALGTRPLICQTTMSLRHTLSQALLKW